MFAGSDPAAVEAALIAAEASIKTTQMLVVGTLGAAGITGVVTWLGGRKTDKVLERLDLLDKRLDEHMKDGHGGQGGDGAGVYVPAPRRPPEFGVGLVAGD